MAEMGAAVVPAAQGSPGAGCDLPEPSSHQQSLECMAGTGGPGSRGVREGTELRAASHFLFSVGPSVFQTITFWKC